MHRLLTYAKVCLPAIAAVAWLGGCLCGPTALADGDPAAGFVFNPQSDYWPTTHWQSSPPEKQGMRSSVLADMFADINDGQYFVYSVMIVRNGYVVAEANRHDPDHRYPIWSTTKAITTALMGIAIAQGRVEGVDQPVGDFLAGDCVATGDPRKQAIRLKHLLSMRSGFDWPETESSLAFHGNPEYQMELSPNWAQYVMNRAMAHSPGETFNYNSGCSILLTAVMQQAGLDVAAFAQRHLFAPLGIARDGYHWSRTSDGMPNGSHGLVMRPRDMARIGYLYLKGGHWNGRQVLPLKWVAESTRRQCRMNWKGFVADHYGYGWFVQPYGFHSLGYQGQYIFVLPAIEVVAVVTAELPLHELELPLRWVEAHIIPAAVTSAALPSDTENQRKLAAEIDRFDGTPFW
jgi:CubicO group peptidase (beta-lactamase class C family)